MEDEQLLASTPRRQVVDEEVGDIFSETRSVVNEGLNRARNALRTTIQMHPGMNWPPRPLFIMQSIISLLILAFCITILAMNEPGCEMNPYLTMVSTIVALWLPNPRA